MLKTKILVYGAAALILIASACSALTPDNPAATLQAQRQGYINEATSIAQAAQAQGTQVMATSAAIQTSVAHVEGLNQQLMGTMQIAFPPTQALIVNGGTSTPGQMASPQPLGSFNSATLPAPGDQTTQDVQTIVPNTTQDATFPPLGSVQFTQVGTALGVRDSDGCANSLTNAFPANVQKIFITTRALNIKQGTQMRVEWYFEGQLTHSENYTVPRDDNDFCMWFSIEPTDQVLSAGNWSVKLFANNQPITPPEVDFTIGQ